MELQEPKIDAVKIQNAANEAAEKAFLNEVTDYYNSYNSPYKKAIKEQLNKQELGWSLELPDVLATLNKALIEEVDNIANTAIAQTYIPMVADVLVKMEKNQKMSELLKGLIADIEPDESEREEFHFEYEKNSQYDWVDCELITDKGNYKFTLHQDYDSRKDSALTAKYSLLSMPHGRLGESTNRTMSIHANDVRIELPFTPNILNDKVLKMFSKVLLSKCEIEMDCNCIDEDWFPRDECHC